MWLVGEAAIFADITPHPEGIGGVPCAFDDDVCPLAHDKGDDIYLVGLDFDEVIGNDCHFVAVDRELLNSLCAAVDQS